MCEWPIMQMICCDFKDSRWLLLRLRSWQHWFRPTISLHQGSTNKRKGCGLTYICSPWPMGGNHLFPKMADGLLTTQQKNIQQNYKSIYFISTETRSNTYPLQKSCRAIGNMQNQCSHVVQCGSCSALSWPKTRQNIRSDSGVIFQLFSCLLLVLLAH